MTLNILYCLDDNYNYQFFSSAISVLDNLTIKVGLYVVHKNPDFLNSIPAEISNHQNIEKLVVIEFDSKYKKFPNLNNSHVSEATYYRLFIENLLPSNVEEILYLDCDVICLRDFANEMKNVSNEMKISGNAIAVNTEFINRSLKNDEEVFNRLDNNLEKYFNAGVMYIDMEKWKSKNVQQLSLNIINEKSKILNYWDQDILNLIFFGNYFEIEKKFNFKITQNLSEDNFEITNNEIFLHYMGSNKPWTLEGLLDENSKYYQENFMKISKDNYHIVNNWRKYSLKIFLKNFFNYFYIKDFKYTIFIKSYFASLIRKSSIK